MQNDHRSGHHKGETKERITFHVRHENIAQIGIYANILDKVNHSRTLVDHDTISIETRHSREQKVLIETIRRALGNAFH